MQNLWAVIRYYDCEGYDVPFGIFSTLERAQQVRDRLQKEPTLCEVEVIEYILDHENE